MKNISLVILTFLSIAFLSFDGKKEEDKYQCIPCGQTCDDILVNEPGKCSKCNKALVKSNSIQFKHTSAESICDYLKAHPKAILLDVRTKTEFEGKADPNLGSLKNAINIPIQELDKRLKELEAYKNQEIVVYCARSRRSPQASYLLTQNGFTQIVNMDGGMSKVADVTCKK